VVEGELEIEIDPVGVLETLIVGDAVRLGVEEREGLGIARY